MIDMRVLELLCARLCHELVSPVSAISNGVELLGEEDPEFVRDAVDLIGQSARRAGKRLQFYRFAYGTRPSAGNAGPDPRELVHGVLDGGKVSAEWPPEAMTLPLDWQRLACNMVVLAVEALPRGGTVSVRPMRGGSSGIEVVARGEATNVTQEMRAGLSAVLAVDDLSSRTVHAYFTGQLARGIGASISIAVPAPGQVAFAAVAA